jgi:hypothetical protein
MPGGRPIAVAVGVWLCAAAPGAAWAADTDGDHVLDSVEDRDHDGNLENNDYDQDGVPDYRDKDDDGDGVDTRDEDFDGDGDPTNDDLDHDDRDDYIDTSSPLDVDGDDYVSAEYGGDDCDDFAYGTHPDAFDAWYDGEDADCLENDDYDQDADGFRDAFRTDGADCDDTNPEIHPGADEDTGRIDVDCDGWSDPVRTLVPTGGCDCGGPGTLGGAATGGLAALLAARRRAR